MKATPAPLHKILGSHTLSQNSYTSGQGLKKFENYHTGLGMLILRELFVKEHHVNAKSSINSSFLETTEKFAHTQHKFNKPKRHCMKWTQIPLEYFSNMATSKNVSSCFVDSPHTVTCITVYMIVSKNHTAQIKRIIDLHAKIWLHRYVNA